MSKALFKKLFINLVGLAGFASIGYGVYTIHAGAAFIVCGLMALAFAVAAVRADS